MDSIQQICCERIQCDAGDQYGCCNLAQFGQSFSHLLSSVESVVASMLSRFLCTCESMFLLPYLYAFIVFALQIIIDYRRFYACYVSLFFLRIARSPVAWASCR